MVRQYVKQPDVYAILKEIANAQFRMSLYFGVPPIVLGIISLRLIKSTTK